MATCGHCKQPGQTVAHVRTCGQAGSAVATAERKAPQFPELVPGNVVTVNLEDGYWLVEANLANDEFYAALVQARGRTAATFHAMQVELVFPNLNAAADYRLAAGALTAKEQISEALHGDPLYCRGCAKGWQGAKWHRDGCPVIAARDTQVAPVPGDYQSEAATRDPWKQVDGLRERVAEHLHRETRQGGSPRVEGRFAVVIEGVTKFLRIKKITSGRWAGRVFVDSQASDSYYPVKAPATLLAYLSAVLVNPQAAAKRYADELDACSDCGRTLTNDESRVRGIGPECWSKH